MRRQCDGSTKYLGMLAILLASSSLAAEPAAPKNPADPTATLKKIIPDQNVWVDMKNKQVVVDGEICLTRGQLEMFAVPKNTKEHEAIVAIGAKAYAVHTGLLAVGAKSGSTVKFEPKYQPATGDKIDIWVC